MTFNPSEELIMAAAKQNLETDQRRSRETPASLMDMEDAELLAMKEPDQVYIDEARQLLVETGENYLPDYPDHKHIKVEVASEGQRAG